MRQRFEPEILAVLREGYGGKALARDLVAGLVVAIVALPLAIAFAIASGVTPDRGIITAIVAGFLISLLGGSRVQIGGPTGAYVAIVFAVVAQHGIDGLILATLMAGLILVLLGALGLGTIIRHVPYPITIGFTAGIALIIGMGQVREALGLQVGAPEGSFLPALLQNIRALDTFNPYALAIALACMLVVMFWPRVTRHVPGSLIALVVATLAVRLLDLPVETIGDRFGEVPRSLPRPHIPSADWGTLRSLVPAAVSIALLGAIESLLSAVIADGMIGTRHRSNAELAAQGIANLVTPLFGGMPATGAIARTATNVKTGGRTPVAGMAHALFLLAILAVMAPLVAHVPLAALAGVLLIVAYHMSEWRVMRRLLSCPVGDVAVLLVTFFTTVLIDVVHALQLGMLLAAVLFMKRIAGLSDAHLVRGIVGGEEDETAPRPKASDLQLPSDVEVFEVQGALFFGATTAFVDAIHRIERPPRVLILRMRSVLAIDATGIRALDMVLDRAHSEGMIILTTGVQPAVKLSMDRAGITARIGNENMMSDIHAALERAEQSRQAPATM